MLNWQWLGVFLLMILTDMVWAVYIRRSAQGKAFSSALAAMVLLLSGGYVVVSYTADHWMLIPAALGSFVGTYITVRFDTRKERP